MPRDHPLPESYRTETLVPMQGTRLPDELLSLGGMAMQALWWEATSGHCPRCGERTERLPGEWGKRCPRCRYEHYPHLHPAVIVLVTDGDRCLLARKAGWAPGRYALVAGFVDNGESFEGTVAREVKEEVGVDVTDIRYVGSQNWPFPSQIMVGFVATYAGGEIKVDPDELEDARWFPRGELPGLPSRHSISRFIIDHYGRVSRGPGGPLLEPPATARLRRQAGARTTVTLDALLLPAIRRRADNAARPSHRSGGLAARAVTRPPRRDRRRRGSSGARPAV